MLRRLLSRNDGVRPVLARHFGALPLETLVTASRTFPLTCRVDLQRALDEVFTTRHPTTPIGVSAQFNPAGLSFAALLTQGPFPSPVVAPLHFEEVDIGEERPARCLASAVWLATEGGVPFAVLLTQVQRYGVTSGAALEVAVSSGAAGADLTGRLFDELDRLVRQAGSYRGKVLSLEASSNYGGQAGSIKVHRLSSVGRHEVILPERTLSLLDRNVTGFIRQRERLRALRLPVKKGLLFYGPPGTGKTHTIHYLAGQVPDHTTLLITAEQVGLLDEYFQLARFLQPSMVVLEDVDLIARARDQMRSACEESLLNRLLNEMDGLREDAEVLFVLTTNRPDQLEAALASRPGRVDQAIEFPLPDEDGRRKLVMLYARDLTVPDEVREDIVRRTRGGSAAFIKELMRRSAQYLIEGGDGAAVAPRHVEQALEEMLVAGGSLNVKLLGGAAAAESP